jgi:hypothetical protein
MEYRAGEAGQRRLLLGLTAQQESKRRLPNTQPCGVDCLRIVVRFAAP